MLLCFFCSEEGNQAAAKQKDFEIVERMKYDGLDKLYKCILGGRTDLRRCPDFIGEDKTDAGQDHGYARVSWGSAEFCGDL